MDERRWRLDQSQPLINNLNPSSCGLSPEQASYFFGLEGSSVYIWLPYCHPALIALRGTIPWWDLVLSFWLKHLTCIWSLHVSHPFFGHHLFYCLYEPYEVNGAENQDSKRINSLPKVTQPGGGRARNWTHMFSIQILCSCHLFTILGFPLLGVVHPNPTCPFHVTLPGQHKLTSQDLVKTSFLENWKENQWIWRIGTTWRVVLIFNSVYKYLIHTDCRHCLARHHLFMHSPLTHLLHKLIEGLQCARPHAGSWG